jgi:transcriptional regulator with XRE-family HTH domain
MEPGVQVLGRFSFKVGRMKEGVDIVVGRRLRARRRLLGLSQQALGSACGVTFQQIHKYESAVCRLSANMLWKLACALDVDMSYFFAGLPRAGDPDDGCDVVALDRERGLSSSYLKLQSPQGFDAVR